MIAELESYEGGELDLGFAALANTMKLWVTTLDHTQSTNDANGKKLYHNKRQGVTFPFVDAFCWTIASYYLIKDIMQLQKHGGENAVIAESLNDYVEFFSNLSKNQVLRTAGEVSRVCWELVHGYACESTEGLEQISDLRATLEKSVMGFRLAKEEAAEALVDVMIPEALDYPA